MSQSFQDQIYTLHTDYFLVRIVEHPSISAGQTFLDSIADGFSRRFTVPPVKVSGNFDKFEVRMDIGKSIIVMLHGDVNTNTLKVVVFAKKSDPIAHYAGFLGYVYEGIRGVVGPSFFILADIVDNNSYVRHVRNQNEMIDLCGFWSISDFGDVERHVYPCYAVYAPSVEESPIIVFSPHRPNL